MTRQWKAFRALQLGRDIWQDIGELFDGEDEIEAAKNAHAYLDENWAPSDDPEGYVLRLLPVDQNAPNIDWTKAAVGRWIIAKAKYAIETCEKEMLEIEKRINAGNELRGIDRQRLERLKKKHVALVADYEKMKEANS